MRQEVYGRHHWNWKGNNVSYAGIHAWLKVHFGKADKCELCKTLTAKFYDWALLKGKTYKRKRENFWMLCRECHRNYDGAWNRGVKYTVRQKAALNLEGLQKGRGWNKGKKIDRDEFPTMGHFIKHSDEAKRKIGFKSLGRIGWNKGLTGVQIIARRKELALRREIKR